MTDVVTNFKPKRIRDRRHLNMVASLTSCVSGQGPCDPHHLRCVPSRGPSMKSDDSEAVPLTREEHTRGKDCVHSVNAEFEEAWFRARGVRVKKLAKDLWAARGDRAAMQRVIDLHRYDRKEN